MFPAELVQLFGMAGLSLDEQVLGIGKVLQAYLRPRTVGGTDIYDRHDSHPALYDALQRPIGRSGTERGPVGSFGNRFLSPLEWCDQFSQHSCTRDCRRALSAEETIRDISR